MRTTRPLVVLLALSVAACAGGDPKPDKPSSSPSSSASARGPREPYIIRREQHVTRLTKQGALTNEYPIFNEPPAGASRIEYRSGGLTLWAWYLTPPDASDADPVPGVMFLHGGFFLKKSDIELVQPFLKAGFAVLLPTLRGRNGNGGNHELLLGEVIDAGNAARWLANRPEVDETRVYTFGHSLGGGTSALLALDADVPLAVTASCGGIYSTDTFRRWAEGSDEKSAELVRFDVGNREEVELRVMAVHADELAHRHIAYLGDKESLFIENAEVAKRNAAKTNAPLEVVIVPGDHMGALKPALERFLQVAKRDAFGE